ncbi:MAG: 4Fe-4S dicluster domain-containing protein [Bacillota bacterium]
MAGKGKVKIDRPDWCKVCGICIEVCPVEVLELGQNRIQIAELDNCIGCENCELSCPDYVLKVVDDDE